MHAVFWIMTLFMTVVALFFVLTPLARAKLRGTSTLLVAAVPTFAALTYFVIGSPEVTSATEHADAMRSADRAAPANVGSVASLTAGLEARLEEQPDDGEGWLLLAKSYFYLGRLDEARHAYARAVTLGNANEAENIWNQELGLVGAGEATVEEAVASICEQIAPVLLESD